MNEQLLRKPGAFATTVPAAPLPLRTHLGLAAYWLPTNLTYLALSVLILPDAVAGFLGAAEKGEALSGLVAVGAAIQLVGPYFGALSDRSAAARGRGPYMVVGTLGLVAPGLLLMAVAPNFVTLGAGYLVYQLCSTLAVQPYTAVVADVVPPTERGTASGFVGLAQFVGSLLAGVLGLVSSLSPKTELAAIGAVNVLCCAWSVAAIKGRRTAMALARAKALAAAGAEAPGAEDLRQPDPYGNWWVMVSAPFKRSRRFCWLFALATGYAASAGVAGLYIMYFYIDVVIAIRDGPLRADDDGGGANAYGTFGALGDALHIHTAQSATAAFLLVNLLFSAVASVAGGAFSDRLERQLKQQQHSTGGATYDDGDPVFHPVDCVEEAEGGVGGGAERVVAAGLLLTAGAYVLLAISQTFVASLVVGALLGVGGGFVMAPMWALAIDVLPTDTENGARDMSVYFLNTLAPQLVIPLVCGQLLSVLRNDASGYAAVWSFAAVLSLLALACCKQLRRHPAASK